MATQNLPPSLSTGQLHPVFARIFENVFPSAIQSVFAPVRRSDAPIYCEVELEQYNGEKCAKVAMVTDLESEKPMCLACFWRSR